MQCIIGLMTVVLISFSALGTEQAPDYLMFEGEQLELNTSWAFPSPMQTYFQFNNQKSVFASANYNTGNYRGHVANWLVENDKLFLSQVVFEGKAKHPSFFGIKSVNPSPSSNGAILADWFSGVLYANDKLYPTDGTNLIGSIIFHIRYGVVISKESISDEELGIIRNSKKGQIPEYLRSKAQLNDLYTDFTDFYFRLAKPDTVNIDNKQGHLNSLSSQNPLLTYFKNDPMKWPFNWENREQNGAPKGKWIIDNKQLFLVEIELHSGGSLYSVESERIELQQVFKHVSDNSRVFAKWLSGLFVIDYGQVKEHPGTAVGRFRNEITLIVIEEGEVIENQSVNANLSYDEVLNQVNSNLAIKLRQAMAK